MFEKSGFICKGINGKIDGTKKQLKNSIVIEPSELELPKLDFSKFITAIPISTTYPLTVNVWQQMQQIFSLPQDQLLVTCK